MKMYRLLMAAFAGTFVYVIVSLAGGNNGYFASQQLAQQKRLLSAEAVKIQGINDALHLECTALEKDPDVISAYARRLGFVREGEKLVKISGLRAFNDNVYETGSVLRYSECYALPEWFCKVCGLMVFAGVYFLLFLSSVKTRRVSKRSVIKEVPIYDLPQV